MVSSDSLSCQSFLSLAPSPISSHQTMKHVHNHKLPQVTDLRIINYFLREEDEIAAQSAITEVSYSKKYHVCKFY